jgi:dTDP-4-dehydrorhamnose 3,5-epimerase
MFKLHETGVPGFLELRPPIHVDARGRFVKSFHQEFFRANGLATEFREHLCSNSRRGVLRGLHFQLPPHDQAKLVLCAVGRIMDVAVDLRIGSPTFGKHASIILNAEQANQAYLANGLAHGFYVLSESATVVYSATTMYAPEYDTGIRWDSVGIQWPDPNPILSERDALLPAFADFVSPFKFLQV